MLLLTINLAFRFGSLIRLQQFISYPDDLHLKRETLITLYDTSKVIITTSIFRRLTPSSQMMQCLHFINAASEKQH